MKLTLVYSHAENLGAVLVLCWKVNKDVRCDVVNEKPIVKRHVVLTYDGNDAESFIKSLPLQPLQWSLA